MPAAERRVEGALKVVVWGGLVLLLGLAVLAGARRFLRDRADAGAGASVAGAQATYIPGGGDYGTLPDFTLLERSGRTVTRQDLAGRFWIANFIFTRCHGLCPLLSARMASLATTLSKGPGAGELRFVSFSVDPSYDTPEVLSRYAAGLGANDPRWLFLTGPKDDLYRLIGEGFRLSVAEHPPAGDDELITHSDRMVLVDPGGRIRGYYHGNDDESAKALVADLEKLRNELGR